MRSTNQNYQSSRTPFKRTFIAAAAALAAVSMQNRFAMADLYSWSSPSTGNWNTPASWNDLTNPTMNGTVPLSSNGTQLEFDAGVSNYTATNNIAQYAVNSVTFNAGNSSTVNVTGVAGNGLVFQGTSPQIVMNGTTTGSASLTTSITYAANMNITNNGMGTLTLGGSSSSYAEVLNDGMTVTNGPNGITNLADGATYSSYGSNAITVHLVNNSTANHSLGIGDMAAVVGTLDVDAGTVYAINTGGDLFGNSLILNVASGATFDFNSNGENMGGVSGAGNIITNNNATITTEEVGDRSFTGVISGSGGFVQNVPSVFSVGGSNTYSGATIIQAGGTIKATAANALSPNSVITLTTPLNTATSTISPNGGTLSLGGYNQTIGGLAGSMYTNTLNVAAATTLTINTSSGVTNTYLSPLGGAGNLVVNGSGSQVLLGSNTLTGTTTVNGGTLRELYASFQASSGTTVGSLGTLDLIVDNNATVSPSSLTDTGSLTKSNAGTLTFSTSGPINLSTLTVNGGSVVLDNTTDNGSKIGSSVALVLGSGNVSLLGNGSAASSQNFVSTSLTGGGSVGVTANGQTATVAVGTITRSLGSAVNFVTTGTAASITTGTVNNATNTIGGYATVNGTDWAVSGTGSGPFTIAPLAAASYATTWNTGNHTNVTGSFTAPSAASTADLRFNSSTAAYTVTLTGANTISTGGILVTPNVGSLNETITGGTSLGAPANQDLVVNQFNPSGKLTIASVIANTPGTAVTYTASSLAASSTITLPSTAGLFPGMIVTNTTDIPAADNAHIVSVNPALSTITISYITAPTAASNVALTFTPGTSLTKTGPGTLALSATNLFTGSVYLDQGTVSVTTAANLGPISGSGSSSVIFNGGTLEDAGNLVGSSGIQPYVFGPGGGTIQVDPTFVTNKTGNTVFGSGTLTKTGTGELEIGSNSSTFTGQVMVNAGIFALTSNQIASSAGVTVATGAQFQLLDTASGPFNFAGNLILNGDGPSKTGAFNHTLDEAGSCAYNFNSPIILASTSRFVENTRVNAGSVDTSNDLIPLPINGPGGLVKDGPGTLTLNAVNAYGGGTNGTVISNGILRIGVNNAIPTTTAPLQFGEASSANSGTLDLYGYNQSVSGLTNLGTGTNHLVTNTTSTLSTVTLNGAGNYTYGGIIGQSPATNYYLFPAGTGNVGLSVALTGTGSQTLSGANSYSGPTQVNSGTLIAGSAHAFGDSASPVTIGSTATLDLAGQTLTAGKSYTLAGGSLINSNTGTTATINTSASATLVSGGTYIAGSTPTVTVDSPASGSTATAVASFQLSGLINFSGGSGYSAVPAVTIPAAPTGGVSAEATATLGITAGSFTISTAGSGFKVGDVATITGGGGSGATIVVTGITGGGSSGGISTFSIQNPGTGFTTAPTTITKSTGSGTGAVITGNATNFQVSAVNFSELGNGYLTPPSLTIAAPTTGTQATATATSTIDQLQISNGGNGYTSNPNITFTGGSTNATATGGYGSINLTADSSIGGAGNLIVNSTITGGNNLTKIGAGTLTLNAGSTYSGNTVLSAGTLVAANTTGSATGSGTLTLNGGTLASGVTGNISGGVIAGNAAHTIAPGGMGTVGSLTIGGLVSTNLTTLNFDLGTGTGPIITNGDLLTLGTAGTTIGAGTAITFGTNPTTGGLDYRLIGDTTGGTTVGAITLSNFSIPTAPAGDTYTLSTSVDPGYIDLVVVSTGPATLTFNNAGTGGGDGLTWDSTSANFNSGSATPVAFSSANKDIVTFNDTNNGHYNVSIPATVIPSSTTVNSTGNYTFSGAGGIGGTGGLTKSGTGTLTLSTSNTYSGATNVSGGTLVLNGANSFPKNTQLNISGGAQVQIASHTGGPANVVVIRTDQANIAGTTGNWNGLIDITNNDLRIHTASLRDVTNQVKAGFQGGTWAGATGITSSTAAGDTSYLTAVGVLLNNDGSGNTIYGTPTGTGTNLGMFDGVNVQLNDVLVKFTYYGDANLDGAVDGSDYTLIDAGFNSGGTLTGWQNGDFNYDGVIDGSDYTLIDNAFNTQGTSLGTNPANLLAGSTAQIASGTGTVPEPATLGLLGILAARALTRRRRSAPDASGRAPE